MLAGKRIAGTWKYFFFSEIRVASVNNSHILVRFCLNDLLLHVLFSKMQIIFY